LSENEIDRGGEHPVYDYEGALDRLMDDAELVQTVDVAFLADMETVFPKARAAVESGDLKQMSLEFHTIKGASSSVGGTALSVRAGELELAVKAGDSEGATAGMAELEQKLAELRTAMAAKFPV